MFDEAKTRMRMMGGDFEHFSIEMGLHQGSVLISFLMGTSMMISHIALV